MKKPQPNNRASLQPAANPLKPRPRLLTVLGIIFALWVAFLLALYFMTVYPQRHPATNATTSSSRQV